MGDQYLSRRQRATEPPVQSPRKARAAPVAVPNLLALQRLAGNRVVTRWVHVQRWDVTTAKKDKAPLIAAIMAKIPGWGAVKENDLKELADVTDDAEQLKKLLNAGLWVSVIKESCLQYTAAVVEKLVDALPGPGKEAARNDVVNKLAKYKAHLTFTPPATDLPSFLNAGPRAIAVKALADAAHDKGEGLVTDAGAKIPRQKVEDKSQVVQNAVKNLDRGALPSGGAFDNREGRLPGARGAGGYIEYDVPPEAGDVDRGARRFVVNNATKFLYYTADHYETFVRIR